MTLSHTADSTPDQASLVGGHRPNRPASQRLSRSRVARLAGRVRGRHLVVVDLAGATVAGIVALLLARDALPAPATLASFAPFLLLVVMIRMAVGVRFGLYSRAWRFASVPDLGRILAAAAVGTLIAVIVVLGVAAVGSWSLIPVVPRAYWVLELPLTLVVVGGVRFGIRVASDWLPRPPAATLRERRPTLLYGAGRTGVMMARSAVRNPDAGVVPVGFLDDDPALRSKYVEGLRVFGGLDTLESAVAETGATAILIAMPTASGTAVRAVVEASGSAGLDVRTVPSMHDLLDGTVDAFRVRRVQVEDLLRRPTSSEHAGAVRDLITDRTVVITGAGGSIGSELARQIHALRPRRMILVDRAESPLYLVQRHLESKTARGSGGGIVRAHLANVASRHAMDRLIGSEAPDVIFHAAAYKHVPMLEEHPSDAAHVNMGGTLALLDAATAAGAGRFVLVSTDKAVQPTSVMGASKHIAEMLVADAARRTQRPYVSVRFGNVLGSTGSVVPIFQEQLERGEPLTITHPDMTRYFMTIPEAAMLILDAAALGTNGDLFVLDMGDPVRIVDLARDLVRLAGRDPETQPISIVGLRPGEKLHEVLFYDAERVQQTHVAKVLRAVTAPPPMTVREDVLAIMALATGIHEPRLREVILAYAHDGSLPNFHVEPTARPPVDDPPAPGRAPRDQGSTVGPRA